MINSDELTDVFIMLVLCEGGDVDKGKGNLGKVSGTLGFVVIRFGFSVSSKSSLSSFKSSKKSTGFRKKIINMKVNNPSPKNVFMAGRIISTRENPANWTVRKKFINDTTAMSKANMH
jgi:hypothetical protein